MTDLDARMSQAAFGALVGISQQAVSDLIARRVLNGQDTARVWLLAYAEHLRQVAAGRDPDGQLASERARLAKENADARAMDNAERRRELLPVGLIELVLGDVARQLSTRLTALTPTLRRTMPDLPATVLAKVQDEVSALCEVCAKINLAEAERLASDTGDEAEGAE